MTASIALLIVGIVLLVIVVGIRCMDLIVYIYDHIPMMIHRMSNVIVFLLSIVCIGAGYILH